MNKGKEGRRKQRSSKEKQDQAATNDSLHVLICMFDFLGIFFMHGIACGFFVVMPWFLLGMIVFSQHSLVISS